MVVGGLGPCTTFPLEHQALILSRASACRDPRQLSAVLPIGPRNVDGAPVADWSTGFLASISEGHTGEFFLDPLTLRRISSL
jgi:hypothetical protein